MEQLRDFADDRLVNGCIYCGGPEQTRDHVPSRVFLNAPFPENLPVVWACLLCNNSFSKDEEYVACLLESVIAGTTDPAAVRRSKVADILTRSPALRAKLEAAKQVQGENVSFDIEAPRVRNVLLKLARGHAAFELSQVCRGEPSTIWWSPLHLLSEEDKDEFECSDMQMYAEIGSRAFQRQSLVFQLALVDPSSGKTKTLNLPVDNWVEVQDGTYRYFAVEDGEGVTIKLVIGGYLAAQVIWSR